MIKIPVTSKQPGFLMSTENLLMLKQVFNLKSRKQSTMINY
jgi:hypothetical protein